MATAQTRQPTEDVGGSGWLITVVDLSTITPDEPVDVTHGGPSSVDPYRMSYEVRTRATPSGSPVLQVSHESASDSASGGTARVRVSTEVGGDLTGAVVRLFFHFNKAASGGIS